jgi:hypothetical protein
MVYSLMECQRERLLCLTSKVEADDIMLLGATVK